MTEDEENAQETEVVKRRPINLQVDLEALEEQLAGMENCRLVIIDPIDAHLTGGNTVAARMWLRSLMLIAAKHQVAMVLVTGLKEGRKSPLRRLMGGLGLAGAARGVWWLAPRVRGQESGVSLLPAKNNLSGERTGLVFRLVMDEGRDLPRVEWSSEVVTETMEEVLELLRQKSAKPSPAVSRAMEYLQEALANGPRLINEVVGEAKEREGISRTSLERARKEMKVRAFRKEYPGAWWICSKEDEAGKTELSWTVEGIDGVDGVEGVDGVGNEAAGRNAESAEDAETRGGEDVEMFEVVSDVEGLDDVDGVGKNAGNGEVLDERTLAAMEAFLRSPSSFGDHKAEGDGNYRGTDSKRERIRQRKLKLKRMKKEGQRQRKMQRAR